MLKAVGAAEFRRTPRGHYVAGNHWLFFAAQRGSFCGAVMWGTLCGEDAREILPIAEIPLKAQLGPIRTLFDVRRVDEIDENAFAAFADHLVVFKRRAAEITEACAIVRGGGRVGALAEGFFRVGGMPYPVEVFERVADAIDWLGAEDAKGIADELDAIQAECVGQDPLLRDLRLLLESVPTLAAERAAAQLGMSARTFRRRLAQAGGRFLEERAHARVRVAQRRLLVPGTKMSALALELGFSSEQHFSTCFRRIAGMSPTVWRVSAAPRR